MTAVEKQGAHPDPLDPALAPPDPATWGPLQRSAWNSPSMQSLRAALAAPGRGSTRDGVLDDLSNRYGYSRDECVRLCVHWEEWSVREWQAATRDTPESLADFYRSTKSWSFDLLWYAYLQVEGHAYPVAPAVAANAPKGPGRHLDFGSGVGTTSQIFRALDYETELADISSSLLEFAHFRHTRRGMLARYIDLNQESLEPGRYDVITAIDTLVHVPDVAETVRVLHRALKPGGLLFANFDVRPPSPENAWHLYSNDLPLRFILQRTGFEPEASLDGMITRYRRVEPNGIAHFTRGVRDTVLLRSPLRATFRAVRDALRRS